MRNIPYRTELVPCDRLSKRSVRVARQHSTLNTNIAKRGSFKPSRDGISGCRDEQRVRSEEVKRFRRTRACSRVGVVDMVGGGRADVMARDHIPKSFCTY